MFLVQSRWTVLCDFVPERVKLYYWLSPTVRTIHHVVCFWRYTTNNETSNVCNFSTTVCVLLLGSSNYELHCAVQANRAAILTTSPWLIYLYNQRWYESSTYWLWGELRNHCWFTMLVRKITTGNTSPSIEEELLSSRRHLIFYILVWIAYCVWEACCER